MKHTIKPLKPTANHLVAVLVHSGNLAAAEKLVRKFYDRNMRIPRSAGEKGSRRLHLTDNRNFVFVGLGKGNAITSEDVRRAASSVVTLAHEQKFFRVTFVAAPTFESEHLSAIAEGAMLTDYQFGVYLPGEKLRQRLSMLVLTTNKEDLEAVNRGARIAEATCYTRDLVNEPVNTLNAVELANRAEALGKQFGFRTEVLNKAKIQSLKMGGLLAVNAGSVDPPTFTIMEWKPKNAVNKKPVVLVGKGVTYDTGGLSLKETPGSMDTMKCDMAGAAAVIGTMCGLAALQIPVHVIGLAPATDNRPGFNAMAPGDVLRMYDGTTVEMLNSDAEGRLLLADALAYAKKYNPGLVIDLATLTGAAIIVIGNNGTVMTSTASDKVTHDLMNSGERTGERMVRMPLWEEFKESLRSDIADMRNIGGKPAGSITPAIFLQHFTNYPWIHLDIAGPAFITAQDSYRGKWATGVGVRLLLDFLSTYSEE